MVVILNILSESWRIFQESAPYVIFGILVAGLLRAFFSPATVAKHLGRGRFLSVLKSALFGVPIPL